MVERRARHFVFLSRSAAPMSQEDPFLIELRSYGCTTTLISSEVGVHDGVIRTMAAAGRPIARALQASMILRDSSFLETAWEQWKMASTPKIRGHGTSTKRYSRSSRAGP